MNAAQFHLLVNHLPSIGQLVGITVFFVGFLLRKNIVRNTGAWIILISAVLVWPASFSGEQAEEVMENQPGVDRNLLHEHEESAELAFVLTLVSALAAATHLAANRWKPNFSRLTSFLILAAGVISLASLFFASHQGGQIMHPEIRSGSNPASYESHPEDND